MPTPSVSTSASPGLAVVTGAGAGIGEQIAAGLARTGATVVLVARDRTRLDLARGRIRDAVPGADLETEPVDLADLAQVRALADRLGERMPSIVVSNAAVIAPLDDRTPAGFHRTLVTNHLAPYLLLRRLAERPAAGPRRFVVVGASPRGLARVPVDLDDSTRRPDADSACRPASARSSPTRAPRT